MRIAVLVSIKHPETKKQENSVKNKLIASILGAILPFSAVAAEGVVSVPSKYSVEKT